MLDHYLHRFTHLHTAASRTHWSPDTRSVSRNDDPRNGMALCRLCNWTFGQGLLWVSPRYLAPHRVGRQLAQSPNVAGHLLTPEGRLIIEPGDDPVVH